MKITTTAQFIERLQEVNRRKAAVLEAFEATLSNPAPERVRVNLFKDEGRNFSLRITEYGDQTAKRSLVLKVNRLAEELDVALDALTKDLQEVV